MSKFQVYAVGGFVLQISHKFAKKCNINVLQKLFKNKDIITVEELISKLEDVDSEVERLEEKIEDMEQYCEDNHKSKW